jgi:ribonuclease BN (tRNA processing enzyme)
MRLTVFGAGTAVPLPQRSPSGYLLQIGEERLLFDIGPGTLARLAAAQCSYRDLTRVFVSHLHSDHVLDIITLLQASNSTPGWKRDRPLELIGCRGLKAFVNDITSIFDGTVPENFELSVTELGAQRCEFDNWVLETALTGHTENSIAFRIETEQASFAYSGDAVECPAVAAVARDANVFVCECSFPRGWETCDHVTADGAGRMAQSAGAQCLVLSHLYPPALRVDVAAQARETYVGEIVVAIDGTTCTFNNSHCE